MDIRFLRSLVAVVETGSIAAAARRENLTAAAISQRIRSLEQVLGASLLDRSAHAAQPTAVALALLPRARQIIEACEMLRIDVDPTGLSGRFTLGAISTALVGLLPPMLTRLQAEAPRLELSVRAGSSSDLYAALEAGFVDGAIIVTPPFAVPKTIRLHPLRTEPLCLIVPAPFAGLGPADVFTRLPLIRYDAASWGGRLASRYLDDHRLSPRVLCDVDGLEATSLMVEQGIGASLVPQWAGLRNFQCLADGERYARELVFATSTWRGAEALLRLILT